MADASHVSNVSDGERGCSDIDMDRETPHREDSTDLQERMLFLPAIGRHRNAQDDKQFSIKRLGDSFVQFYIHCVVD